MTTVLIYLLLLGAGLGALLAGIDALLRRTGWTFLNRPEDPPATWWEEHD